MRKVDGSGMMPSVTRSVARSSKYGAKSPASPDGLPPSSAVASFEANRTLAGIDASPLQQQRHAGGGTAGILSRPQPRFFRAGRRFLAPGCPRPGSDPICQGPVGEGRLCSAQLAARPSPRLEPPGYQLGSPATIATRFIYACTGNDAFPHGE